MEKYSLIETRFLVWADRYFGQDIRLINNELDINYIIDSYNKDFNTKISITNFIKKLDIWCKFRGYRIEFTRRSLKYIIVKRKELKDYCKGCYYVRRSDELEGDMDVLDNILRKFEKQRNRWRILAEGTLLVYLINIILYFIL